MEKIVTYKKDGKKGKEIDLSSEIFGVRVNERLLELVLRMYGNNKRTGNAHTKTRAEVRGGSKKPWRQKGTGRARVSSIRSPLWRGGGTVFGPRKRDIYYAIPKEIKRQALISALSKKYKEDAIVVVDDLTLSSHKTKELFNILVNVGIEEKKALFITGNLDENTEKASGNIEKLSVRRVLDVNAYQIMRKRVILLDVATVEMLEKRILAAKGGKQEEASVA